MCFVIFRPLSRRNRIERTIERSNDRTSERSKDRTGERSNKRTIERSNNRTIEQSNNKNNCWHGRTNAKPSKFGFRELFFCKNNKVVFHSNAFPDWLACIVPFRKQFSRKTLSDAAIHRLPRKKKGVRKMRPVPGDSGRSSSYFRIRHS